MDFKSLNYVLAVAQTGSISKAAQNLGISQPSLSRYIKNLNHSLDIQLFVRKADKLVLTDAGERYVRTAERILELSKDLYDLHRETQTEYSTAMIVSTPFKEGYYIHPFAIMQFAKRYPAAKLVLKSNDGIISDIFFGLNEPDITIAAQIQAHKELVFEPLLEDEICLVTANGHPCSQRAIWREGCRHLWLDMESVKYENFILLPADMPLGRRIREFLSERGINPGQIIETDNIDYAINLAVTGAGICFVPSSRLQFASYIAGAPKCFSVGNPFKLDICFVYPINRPPDERTAYFMELIRSFIDT